jgi:hypothetical protein
MAASVRIDDLREPRLTDVQRAALAHAETRPVTLSVEEVLKEAVRRTGLEDFGEEDFVERLGLWLGEMNTDPDRTALGRLGTFGDCVRNASNRLRLVDLLGRHPEIHDVEITRPIIVVGLPRSGTTHLVNILASDERLRSMPLWESYEPVPDPTEAPDQDGRDPRWVRCQQQWEGMQAVSPYIASMHPMAPDHIHEEIELEHSDFSGYSLEWVCRCPGWRDYYLSHDQTPHYAWMKTGLKVLQWFRPRDRWVLKSPQHLEQLGPLLTTFPDATVVVTHRDPVAVVQSAATMLTYGSRLGYKTTDPRWYIDYWGDRIHRLLERSVRDRAMIPNGRSIDVLFHEFMANEMGTIESIYEVADLPMTDEARTGIARYLAEHPRGRDGQLIYDLRGDFGVEPADMRARFDFYLDRFAVREEVF